MSVRIITGDCREQLATLPAGSVHCCVTSPPYFGLRDYGVAGQIGLEATPEAYVAEMVAVFRQVRRVLRDDGTCWLNLGDSYAGSWGAQGKRVTPEQEGWRNSIRNHPKMARTPGAAGRFGGAKPKDLLMMPARVALALQADGWWLRSDIIWHKPNPMPESITDRPTSAHEHLFLLSKSERYFYDADAIREAVQPSTLARLDQDVDQQAGSARANGGAKTNGPMRAVGGSEGRNARNVWTIASQPYSGAHFATMPPDLAERCIKAGTSERGCCPCCGTPWVRSLGPAVKTGGRGAGNGFARPQRLSVEGRGNQAPWEPTTRATTGWAPGCTCPDLAPTPCTVLDPFGGAGTTGLVADRLQRNAILIEINPAYAGMGSQRVASDAGMFAGVAAE